MLTLGSSEVILKGAKVPGLCQSLPPSPRRLWDLNSVESGSGRLTYLAETKGAVVFPVSILATLWTESWRRARWRAVFLPNVLSGCLWSRPLEACIVVQPVSKLEEVASGQQKAGPFGGLKPQLSYKYLKCHFHKISLGGLRATLCLFKFSLNISEGLGNKMRGENNCSILGRWVSCQVISYAWVRYLNSLI
jgi:hypothetical protein